MASGAVSGGTPPGSVVAWGLNGDGQLGNGTTANSSTPVQVVGVGGTGTLSGVVAVGAGFDASVALRSDGSVDTWGYNTDGELGNGTTTNSSTPVQVEGVGGTGTLSGVVAIAAGGYNSLALRSDGSVVAWGYNGVGELGNGTTTNSSTPVQVEGVGGTGTLTGAAAIAAGYLHDLALRSDGSVVAWADNSEGELGNGTTTNSSTPVQVEGVGGTGTLTGVVAVAAGGLHSLALLSDGTVVAWGDNGEGQLGNGTTTNSSTPVQVEGVGGAGTLSGVVAIAAGLYDSVALLANGSVVAWGDNTDGELGNGTTTNSSSPVQVEGVGGTGTLTGIAAIGAGAYHDLALRSDGGVDAWGYNSDGEIGNGTTTNSSTPVPVLDVGGGGTLAGVVAVGHMDYAEHSLAIQGAFASLAPTTLAFGGQRTGTASAAQTVTLTNDGPAPLTVSGETLTGAGAAAFQRTADGCAGATLAAGSSCRVALHFAPTGTGTHTATLAFQSTAANALASVALSGTGLSPVLSALKLSPARFRAAPSGPTVLAAAARDYGTVITYRDSEPAVTTLSVQRPIAAIRRGGRCIRRPRHASKHARRCTLYRTLVRFTHADKAAVNRLIFTGRVAHHKLTPGRYRLRAIARKSGTASVARVAKFRIKP